MSMLAVVPGEELRTEVPRILLRTKAVRKCRTVLERLELTFRERIVVRDVRPIQAAGHAEIGQQQSHWFGSHRRAAIRMNDQLAQGDALFQTTRQEQFF